MNRAQKMAFAAIAGVSVILVAVELGSYLSSRRPKEKKKENILQTLHIGIPNMQEGEFGRNMRNLEEGYINPLDMKFHFTDNDGNGRTEFLLDYQGKKYRLQVDPMYKKSPHLTTLD